MLSQCRGDWRDRCQWQRAGVEPASLSLDFRRGNARADTAISVADLLFLGQRLAGLRPSCAAEMPLACVQPVNGASVKYDGDFDRATIADIVYIAPYLVGLRDEFYNRKP